MTSRISGVWEAERSKGLFGVNILGHFRYPCGLERNARWLAESFQRVGVVTACCDVPLAPPALTIPAVEEPFPVTLMAIQPEPCFDTCYRHSGLRPREDCYRIAYWAWELEEVPRHWAEVARKNRVREVWTLSRFAEQALRRTLSTPVYCVPPGLELGEVGPLARHRLGVADDQVLFLFLFDMGSIFERKNPLALIEAYRQAFRPGDRARLVIKVANGDSYPGNLLLLRQAAREAGVILLCEPLPYAEVLGLIACCDCYVSVHRSEGLGLTLAEAMLLGKPVIATGYSGNLDFMTADNSLLVPYRLIEDERYIPIYGKDVRWAEPSLAAAASLMRWVYEHPDEARQLGRRGQEEARHWLDLERCGRRMLTRVRALVGPSSSSDV